MGLNQKDKGENYHTKVSVIKKIKQLGVILQMRNYIDGVLNLETPSDLLTDRPRL